MQVAIIPAILTCKMTLGVIGQLPLKRKRLPRTKTKTSEFDKFCVTKNWHLCASSGIFFPTPAPGKRGCSYMYPQAASAAATEARLEVPMHLHRPSSQGPPSQVEEAAYCVRCPNQEFRCSLTRLSLPFLSVAWAGVQYSCPRRRDKELPLPVCCGQVETTTSCPDIFPT